MLRVDELRHLRSGPRDGEATDGVGLVGVAAVAADAPAVLQRVRDVLEVVVAGGLEPVERVRGTLPAWFLAGCAPTRSEAEDEAWLTWWRSLDPAGRAAAERERSWTLEVWLGWFAPDERGWWWWSGEAADDHHLRVEVQVDGWPTPLGTLVRLLRVAGVTSVEVDA